VFLCLGISHASITGPVISTDFPDPSIIEVNDTWYAFATCGAGLNVRYLAGLHHLDTAPITGSFACPTEQGGAIDADGFLDPETGYRYVAYKVDGDGIGHGGNCNNGVAPIIPTPIMLQRVEQDGYSLVGTAVQIPHRSDADGPLVEAPSLVRSADGVYVLSFSSNCYSGSLYDLSYATAQHVDGPYTKSRCLSPGMGRIYMRRVVRTSILMARSWCFMLILGGMGLRIGKCTRPRLRFKGLRCPYEFLVSGVVQVGAENGLWLLRWDRYVDVEIVIYDCNDHERDCRMASTISLM
jgi:hypothetical protein